VLRRHWGVEAKKEEEGAEEEEEDDANAQWMHQTAACKRRQQAVHDLCLDRFLFRFEMLSEIGLYKLEPRVQERLDRVTGRGWLRETGQQGEIKPKVEVQCGGEGVLPSQSTRRQQQRGGQGTFRGGS